MGGREKICFGKLFAVERDRMICSYLQHANTDFIFMAEHLHWFSVSLKDVTLVVYNCVVSLYGPPFQPNEEKNVAFILHLCLCDRQMGTLQLVFIGFFCAILFLLNWWTRFPPQEGSKDAVNEQQLQLHLIGIRLKENLWSNAVVPAFCWSVKSLKC